MGDVACVEALDQAEMAQLHPIIDIFYLFNKILGNSF